MASTNVTKTFTQTKDLGGLGLDTVGEQLEYTVTVSVVPTNPADTYQFDVALDDSLLDLDLVGGDTNGNGKLDPGETWTYTGTYTLTQDDLDNDTVLRNVAEFTLTGTYDPFGPGAASPVTLLGSESAVAFLTLSPAIHIEKATNGEDADDPTGPFVAAGEAVTWTYTVTNTGNTALGDVVVVDDAGTAGDTSDDITLTVADLVSGDLDNDQRLDVGETWAFSASGIAAAGQYGNVASVTGKDPGDTEVEDSDPSHYFGVVSAIDIEKATNGEDADTATGPLIGVGETVNWTYVVTNTGNSDLTDVVVIDDQGVTLTRDDSTDVGGDDVLGAGESWTFTASGIAEAGQYANIGSVTGLDAVGRTVSDDDPSHYFGVASAIAIEKDGSFNDENSDGFAQIGETITYSYRVTTGTGNVPLANVNVVDDAGTPSDAGDDFSPTFTGGDDGDGVLELGETWSYTASVSVTQAHIDAGGIVNIACATGEDPTGQTVDDCDDADVPLTPPPPPDDHPGRAQTPGFWKNHAAVFEQETGVSSSAKYEQVFGVDVVGGKKFSSNPTLLEALSAPGGHEAAFLRASTAAWANASSDDLNYCFDEDELGSKFDFVVGTLDQIDNAFTDDDCLDDAEIEALVRDVYDAPGATTDFFHFGDAGTVASALDAMNNMTHIDTSEFLA